MHPDTQTGIPGIQHEKVKTKLLNLKGSYLSKAKKKYLAWILVSNLSHFPQ